MNSLNFNIDVVAIETLAILRGHSGDRLGALMNLCKEICYSGAVGGNSLWNIAMTLEHLDLEPMRMVSEMKSLKESVVIVAQLNFDDDVTKKISIIANAI